MGTERPTSHVKRKDPKEQNGKKEKFKQKKQPPLPNTRKAFNSKLLTSKKIN
jgi:hypothetical protein